MPRLYYCLLLFLLTTVVAPAQSTTDSPSDYLYWSATRRLTPADFHLRLKQDGRVQGSSGIYGFGLKGNVYDLLGKRANQAVQNRMLRSGSWLDTTDRADVRLQLQYHQTSFDISEIYARRLRQKLRSVAKNVLLWGKPSLEDVINEHLQASQQRQVAYIEETAYGSVPEKQAAWEQQIQQELRELAAYAVADE
ncbi:hypothetical protein [Hymenobacter psychrophilus]|uniref:Uncharacterized protein n=1 Tax=Hymenobacter psychrophilus TaxID=651662 RepID=A0A1H3HPJ4_9BACT|nr:hypothetical protein [Hymenobacter psychrophilus]SDY17145.1 hypothetical protein SAMN04488069_10681 [Hymenobacter psychrophilus]